MLLPLVAKFSHFFARTAEGPAQHVVPLGRHRGSKHRQTLRTPMLGCSGPRDCRAAIVSSCSIAPRRFACPPSERARSQDYSALRHNPALRRAPTANAQTRLPADSGAIRPSRDYFVLPENLVGFATLAHNWRPPHPLVLLEACNYLNCNLLDEVSDLIATLSATPKLLHPAFLFGRDWRQESRAPQRCSVARALPSPLEQLHHRFAFSRGKRHP